MLRKDHTFLITIFPASIQQHWPASWEEYSSLLLTIAVDFQNAFALHQYNDGKDFPTSAAEGVQCCRLFAGNGSFVLLLYNKVYIGVIQGQYRDNGKEDGND